MTSIRQGSSAPLGGSGSTRGAWTVAVAVGAALGLLSTIADGIITARLIVTLGNIAAPWGIAAFLVGLRARSWWQGALMGGVALAVGLVLYYGIAVLRGYVVGTPTVIWTVVAAGTGPVMGLCGALIATRRARAPLLVVAAPSAMLVAEAIFFTLDRRIWRYNFVAEPYRWIDAMIVATLVVGALWVPWLLADEPFRRRAAYALAALGGVAGASGLVLVRTLIVGG